ncbi:GntR family transcriptional regulator [Cryobacterium sp. SO2]|uniref:GntR family transcriptional regulator n=1 Tax=Cryobacterium sp. SO2 TaxID=1897060 RepID=UPI00223CF055|nr:GntR family transcriptional regulator [Cryobacterium sp. SO2]WEO77773.1 GntR family transcriptional regulator [Cryobacterium sp. SO2]
MPCEHPQYGALARHPAVLARFGLVCVKLETRVGCARHGWRGTVASTGGETVYLTLRARILSGELAAHAVLREQALAQELGVSRTPVREALRRLDEAGLVTFVPNRGATVVAWSIEQVRETYFVRAILESRAAGLAAAGITTAELERLADLIDAMEPLVTATDDAGLTDLAALNAEFHRIVVTAARSPQLLTLTASVARVPQMSDAFRRDGAQFRARSNHQHRDILTALSTGDVAWAEVAMRSHILSARNAVVEN